MTEKAKLNIQLSLDDVNRLLTLLGDQTIKSGLSDLTHDIRNQAQAQITTSSTAEEV